MISKEIENADARVISLGAGVQSSVMALMAAKGELTPKYEEKWSEMLGYTMGTKGCI